MDPRISRFAVVIASCAVLAACEGTFGTKAEEETQPAAVESSQPADTSSATTQGIGSGSTYQGHVLDDPSSLLSTRVVHFEFDSAEVRPEDRPTIEAHAGYLAANPAAAITLEGHADERGSREYNVALGERRANSVRQLMTLLGASGQQIQTVSYGEERPIATGHDEVSWAENRRVEIIYRTR